MVKVLEHGPKPGRVWSLELPARVGRRRLARVLASVPGVQLSHHPGWFSWLADRPFCRFEYKGVQFAVEAEWPAFNVFSIAPDPGGCKPETLEIKAALEERL